MATLNPLEQKARSSFIKGFVVALLLGIVGVGVLGMMYFQKIGEESERIKAQKEVIVLNQDVTSGQEIKESMITTVKVDGTVAPTGAPTSYVGLLAAFKSGGDDSEGTKTTLIAKTNISSKSIITTNMVSLDTEQPTNDLRTEQYNMIVLPSDLNSDETVDIRLRLPSGQDYIVLSKKKITIPNISGETSSTTIQAKVTEDEILTMSAAIVDAYKIAGSKLYAIKYAEPGMQEKATATYIPAADTLRLISEDPNIVAEAKATLINYYNQNNDKFRAGVANALSTVDETTQQSAVQSGTTTETSAQKAEREKYLQAFEE